MRDVATVDPRTDEQLIAALQRGDTGAFDVLYARYRDWVYGVALRFGRDHDDALDVLQDTFTYLVRRLPSLALTARLTTFLYPTVKFLALRRRQKRGREAEGETLLPLVAASDDGEPAGESPREALAGLLVHLSEEQREVLLLHFVDGLTLVEVAEALRVPVGTVKSRLHKALVILRDDPRTRRYFDVDERD